MTNFMRNRGGFDIWLIRIELPGVHVKQISVFVFKNCLNPLFKQWERDESKIGAAAKRENENSKFEVRNSKFQFQVGDGKFEKAVGKAVRDAGMTVLTDFHLTIPVVKAK